MHVLWSKKTRRIAPQKFLRKSKDLNLYFEIDLLTHLLQHDDRMARTTQPPLYSYPYLLPDDPIAHLAPQTSTQLDLAGLEVGGGGGSGVGGDLSLYPEEWGGAGGGKAAAAAYSKLRAHVFALEQSLVASKARLHTLEGLKVPGWSEAGALAMHHGVSVQSEVNRAEKLLGLLRDLHAKKK